MSEHNLKTIQMYQTGGALEYLHNNEVDPEEDKWKRLFDYIEKGLNSDKSKSIVEFGSGGGQIALMLQNAGYDVTATDVVDDFLKELRRIGIQKVKHYNFLEESYDDIFDSKADLILSWRNPHLDIEDVRKLFHVVYSGLQENGLFVVNFQNAEMHPKAEILSNGTRYEYKVLADKKTNEKRFYAYYSKEEIDSLLDGFFEVLEYHNEGGSKQKNWHVFTLRKIKK